MKDSEQQEQVAHQLGGPDSGQVSGSNKRVALVTGSATGIGASISISMAAAGYNVIITGRDTGNMSRVVKLCNDTAGKDAAVAFTADLYDMSQVDDLIAFTKLKFGRIAVLVNNACDRGNVKNILADGAFDDLKKVMHLNVFIPMYMIHKFLTELRQPSTETNATNVTTDKFVVVNISSIASQTVVPLHLYSISKACLSELTRQVSIMTQYDDLMRNRVAAFTVSPGPVLTDERPHHQSMSNLTLLNRVGTPKEIADLVMFALDRPFLFDGQELVIDGGYLAQRKLNQTGVIH